MYENRDTFLLDLHPKTSSYGSHEYDYRLFDVGSFDTNDPIYLQDEPNSSSISPQSFDISDDFNEFNEDLLTKLIDEFSQQPLPNPSDFNNLFNDDIIYECPIPNYLELKLPYTNRKRKTAYDECNDFEDLDIHIKKFKNDDSYTEKKSCNSDAAFRYRQKQKKNKSKVEDDLNQSAIEMVTAKNEMLEMRKKLNTVKNIVKDLLRDKGVENSFPF